jgi:hypothetical protein
MLVVPVISMEFRRAPPMPQSPKLLPKKKTLDKRVFLEPKLWDEMTEVAEFHTLVFEAMGASEKVSRNDIIAAFLRWAVDSYWEDKGGVPSTKDERTRKARAYAERLAKEAK